MTVSSIPLSDSKRTHAPLLKQVLQYAPGALTPAVLGLLSASIFTRVLSVDAFGRYSVVLSLTSLIATLASQWLQQGIGRFLPGQDSVTVMKLKAAAGSALTLITLVVGGTAVAAISALGWMFDPDWRLALWPTAILVTTTALFNPLSTILQAEMRPLRHSAYQVANVALRFGLSVSALFFVSKHWSGVVWANAIATALIVPLMWRDVRLPENSWAFQRRSDTLATIRKIGAYGFPMIGWFVASTLLSVGDRLIIQVFRGAAEVGVYSANYSLVSRGVGLAAAPILLAAHPLLMRTWSTGDEAAAGRLLGRIVEWFIALGVLVVGTAVLFAGDIAQLVLGIGYREGYVIMPVVLAGEFLWQLGMYAQKPLEFAGKTTVMLRLNLAIALVNILLNCAFVPVFGYVAAAYTTLICYAVYSIAVGNIGRRFLKWKIRWGSILATIGMTTGFAVAASFVRQLAATLYGYNTGLAVGAAMMLGATALVFFTILRPVMRELS